MSKHKRNRKHKNVNNNPENMDNITELLNNTDVNKLSSLLSSLTDGQKNENLASEDIKQTINEENKSAANRDRDIALLNALKPFLSTQKAEILEKFIEIYTHKENEKK
jgi:hypothetical protein